MLEFRDEAEEPAPELDRGGGQTTSLHSGAHDAVLVGRDPAMAEVFELIGQAASNTIPVLIQGETGTGKELVASAIHKASARARKPFQAINCAAIPEELLESELFGHRRGAFTGAQSDRRGLIEATQGGTLFLDEVGEMALSVQPKLLRVLQQREVTRLGENEARPVDVRLIAATNRNLLADAEAGRFRSDLYYRLSAFPILVPPLRERRGDIPLLAEIFLTAFSRQHGKRFLGISPPAVEVLARFPWPGNVRELQNEMQRAATLAKVGQAIGVAELSAKLTTKASGDSASAAPEVSPEDAGSASTLFEARRRFEAAYLTEVMEREGNAMTSVARTLGLSRAGLYKKLKELGLRR